MYKKTYSQLASLIKNLSNNLSVNDPQIQQKLDFLNANYSSHRNVILGLAFLGQSLEQGLLQFRSNRYFLDSVGIKLFPDISTLRQELALLKKNYMRQFSTTVDFMLELGEALNSIDDYFKNVTTPDIYQNFTIPKISKKELDFLDVNGYLVVENVLDLSLCDELHKRVVAVAAWEANSSSGGYIYGSGRMQRIYHLLSKDLIFRSLVMHPLAHEIMSYMFHRSTYHDKYYLTSFHANIIASGGEPQIWHIDSNVPDPIPPWIIRANSNFIIQDYTKENGSTQIIPGSHKWLRKPNNLEAQSLNEKQIISVTAPKGSIVFWHGSLWHRSGENKTETNRIALLATYAASHLREMCMEENHYLAMSGNVIESLNESLKTLLGWNHGSKNY